MNLKNFVHYLNFQIILKFLIHQKILQLNKNANQINNNFSIQKLHFNNNNLIINNNNNNKSHL